MGTDVEKILRNEYVCKGTLSCPFTPDWLRKIESEKQQAQISLLEKVLKEYLSREGVDEKTAEPYYIQDARFE